MNQPLRCFMVVVFPVNVRLHLDDVVVRGRTGNVKAELLLESLLDIGHCNG